MLEKKVKLKANENYRGDGFYAKAGDIFEVSPEKAKQLKADFPKKFSSPSSNKKKKSK